MSDSRYKFVRYDQYCNSCKYKDNNEADDPCWDCLDEPVNIDSHKPTKYEKAPESESVS